MPRDAHAAGRLARRAATDPGVDDRDAVVARGHRGVTDGGKTSPAKRRRAVRTMRHPGERGAPVLRRSDTDLELAGGVAACTSPTRRAGQCERPRARRAPSPRSGGRWRAPTPSRSLAPTRRRDPPPTGPRPSGTASGTSPSGLRTSPAPTATARRAPRGAPRYRDRAGTRTGSGNPRSPPSTTASGLPTSTTRTGNPSTSIGEVPSGSWG